MADVCASVVVVLGTAWVVRWVMDWPDRQPLTPVRRRRWVFLSLLLSVAVHAVLAGFALISWRSTAIPVTLVGIWLVLCRLMVRPGRDTRYTSPPAPGGWQPAVLRRLSPATLALTLAAILTLWVALNPLGDDRNTAVAATSSARDRTSVEHAGGGADRTCAPDHRSIEKCHHGPGRPCRRHGGDASCRALRRPPRRAP